MSGWLTWILWVAILLAVVIILWRFVLSGSGDDPEGYLLPVGISPWRFPDVR